MKELLLCVAVVLLAGCGEKSQPLPIYGQIPDFVLTSQTGEEFHGSSLKGDVWVADFIFTRCPGPCPRMSSLMKKVQEQVKQFHNVKLVSFTVDPAYDDSKILATYAKRYQAEPGRWYFLTGPQKTLNDLCRNAFKLGNVDGSLIHSTRFVLMDRKGRIRGYYRTQEDEGWRQVIPDIRKVLRERS